MNLAEELALDPIACRVAFGAARVVVEASGRAGERGCALLDVLSRSLGLGAGWEESLPPVTPDDLAAAFPSPKARRALVDALLIPACIEGTVTPEGETVVRGYAAALAVRSHWVDLLPALRKGHVFAVKRQLARRSPDARRLFARTWSEEGIGGLWRALLFVLGRYEDPALAARFHALASLPSGTLGRTFHDALVSRSLSFPGEVGGLPERMLHHDLMHVINGYGTDAAGECEVAGFYAGFCEGDAFTFIVIALSTFHLGLAVSPAIVTTTRGAFDPARVLAAFLRGRRLNDDVMGRWDYWSLMPLPIQDARERLGIGSR